MEAAISPPRYLDRLRGQDPEACARCVKEHADGLCLLALRLLGDPAEGEDVVQEAFPSAFRNVPGLAGRSEAATRRFRIAYNASLICLRRNNPLTVPLNELEASPEPGPVREIFDWSHLAEAEVLDAEGRRQTEVAIAGLPPLVNPVFLLRELEGQTTSNSMAQRNKRKSFMRKAITKTSLAVASVTSVYL